MVAHRTRSVVWLYLALCLMCTVAPGAETISKSYPVGSLIKLTASDSVGWDVDAGLQAIPFDTNDEHTACFIGTGPVPTRFVVKCSTVKQLANGKTVPQVAARYLITITAAGPNPDPVNPNPPPPPSPGPVPPAPPTDVLNELGVGMAVYQAAVVVGDKTACAAMASSLENSAVGLEHSTGSEVAIKASLATVNAALRSAMQETRWEAARKKIEVALESSLGKATGNQYQFYVALFREAASGFKAAAR